MTLFRKAVSSAAIVLMVAGSLVGAGVVTASASTSSACGALQSLKVDTTSAASVRKQVTKLLAAKPPVDVAIALKTIKRNKSSAAVKSALSAIAVFLGKCASNSSNSSKASACPLTAEQVSAVLGATVDKDETSCTYYPADDAWPNATFDRQVSNVCDAAQLSALGYSEKLDGLGEKAYVQRETATGPRILVCTDDPFEVNVDIPDDENAAVNAAEQLAKEVLGS